METNINKLISVWRGDNTPPTDYHLWEKSDGSILTKIENQWKQLTSPVDKETLDDLSKDVSKLKKLQIVEISPTSSNVLTSYQLKANDDTYGTTINIPKDKSLKDVKLGYSDATVDTSTGEINIGTVIPEGPQYLIYSMAINDGTYTMIKINLSQFLTDKEYTDGLELNNNKLKVKVDPTSEEYLSVSADGVKILGLNSKFSDLNSKISSLEIKTYPEDLLKVDDTWTKEEIENLFLQDGVVRFPEMGDYINFEEDICIVTNSYHETYPEGFLISIEYRNYVEDLIKLQFIYVYNDIVHVDKISKSSITNIPYRIYVNGGKVVGRDSDIIYFLDDVTGTREDNLTQIFADIRYTIEKLEYTRLVLLSNLVTTYSNEDTGVGYVHLSGIANDIEGIEGLSLVEIIFKVDFSKKTLLDNGTYKVRSLQIKDYIGDGLKLSDSGKIVLDIPEGYDLMLCRQDRYA